MFIKVYIKSSYKLDNILGKNSLFTKLQVFFNTFYDNIIVKSLIGLKPKKPLIVLIKAPFHYKTTKHQLTPIKYKANLLISFKNYTYNIKSINNLVYLVNILQNFVITTNSHTNTIYRTEITISISFKQLFSI